MEAVTFGSRKEEYTFGDSSRIAYGIVAYADAEIGGTFTVIASVSDISAEKESAERLAELCNANQVSVEHLQDIVDDYLAG